MSSGGSPFDFSRYTGASTPSATEGSPSSPSFNAESNVAVGTEVTFSDSAFTHYPRPSAPQVINAQVTWLSITAAVAAIAMVLATLFGGSPVAAISAWVLGGPVAI